MRASHTKRAAWCTVAMGLSLAAVASLNPNIVFPTRARSANTTRHAKAKPSSAYKAFLKKAMAARAFSPAVPVVSGSVAPKAIEIEEGVSGNATKIGTNLYPRDLTATDPVLSVPLFANDALATFLGFNNAALANTPQLNNDNVPFIDWVKDTLVNNDPASVNGGIATGIMNGVSGTLFNNQKRGHWNGARIVDGIAGAELDQFVKGGKEDDTSTWTIDGGSIGSSKYDITQAFIANTTYPTNDTVNFPKGHKDVLYFGMERRGNNGTTAFDFEFNQLPPLTAYVPHRSEGDVLFTFEMNGSATSGSAVPHVYIYHNGNYLSNEILANSLPAARRPVSTINQKTTPSAPWGFVNDKGNWEIGQIPVFSVAEAAVPFGVDFLQGVTACGGTAYVQVRTRSSVTNTSDLKDTTKIFEYTFGGPTADLQLQSNCGQTFDYAGVGSHDSQGGSNLTYKWQFSVPSGVTLSGAPELGADPAFPGDATKYAATFSSDTVRTISVSLPVGAAYADIDAKLTVVEGATCSDVTGVHTVRVWRALDAAPTLTPACNALSIDYGSTVTGGKSPYSYSWTLYKKGTPDTVEATSSTSSGTFTPSAKGDYYAVLAVNDTADTSSDSRVIAKGSCQVQKTTNVVHVDDPMNPAAVKDSASGTNLTVTLKVTYSGPANVQWQKLVAGVWTNVSGGTADTLTYSSFESDATPTATTFTAGGSSYTGKLYTMKFRAKTSRTTNGGCEQTSNEVTVTKIIAVDP